MKKTLSMERKAARTSSFQSLSLMDFCSDYRQYFNVACEYRTRNARSKSFLLDNARDYSRHSSCFVGFVEKI